MNENPNFGSPQPILLGIGTHTLVNTYLIQPNNNSCIISSLKRNDTLDTNWAVELGFANINLNDATVPIEVEYRKYWSEITITSGSVWAYNKLPNRVK